MNIVHVIPYFQPSYGYEEYYHATAHAKLGANVTVITSKYYHPNIAKPRKAINSEVEDKKAPFQVVRLASIELKYSSQNILIGLNNAIRAARPNAIYLHGPECLAYCLIKKSIQKKVPTLVDVHKDGVKRSRISNPSLKEKILATIKRWVVNQNLKDCKHILFFSSEHRAEYLRELKGGWESKAVTLFMPLDSGTFSFDNSRRLKFRKAFACDDDTTIVSFTGRLTEDKHVLEFVRAFRAISNENIVLFLAGDLQQGYANHIKDACGDLLSQGKVRLLPRLSRDGLADLYNGSEFAVWPFHMSVGILEALSCGATVLTGADSKKYYESIPAEGVLDGALENYISAILNAHRQGPAGRGRLVRERNASAVSHLTYESLAENTMRLCRLNELEKNDLM